MKPDAWIIHTKYGNEMLSFKKPNPSPPCYTGVQIKESLEPLYSAATIRNELGDLLRRASQELADRGGLESMPLVYEIAAKLQELEQDEGET